MARYNPAAHGSNAAIPAAPKVTPPAAGGRKREPRPMAEVLEWLHTNHPRLHATAEVERDWLWLVCDLRGENNRPTRDSIKAFGFRFAKKGHTLPSGKLAMWGHSCLRPTRFHGKKKNQPHADSKQSEDREMTLEEALSAFV